LNNAADDPWFVPTTAVLLARSCIDCGRLLSAHHFWGGEGKRRQDCFNCSRKRMQPKQLAQQRETAKDWYEYCQELTKAVAVRASSRWTLDDAVVLRDTSKSNLDAALELRRTYASVCAQRRRLGVAARRPVEEWRIILPEHAG
jgi:hypothetical protein